MPSAAVEATFVVMPVFPVVRRLRWRTLALLVLPLSAATPGDLTFDFAPRGATHAPNARYRLPYRTKIPRLMSNGPGMRSHAEEPEYNAFDFALPIGTEVLAARPGRVVHIRDGDTKGGLADEFKKTGNAVIVLHGDGTFAWYLHLSPGIAVKQGQELSKGALLGRSGNTGYSGAPHLHFVVQRLSADGRRLSVPIRFGGRKGFVPEPMQYYGSPPKPNATLRLYVAGREVGAAAVKVRPGEEVTLRIVVEDAAGRSSDVSEHPRTEIASMTPWSAQAVGRSGIVFRPMPGFDFSGTEAAKTPDMNRATVAVFHGNRGDPVVAIGRVEFEITP